MSGQSRSTEENAPPPIGTLVLLSIVAAGMTLAWLFLYFGVFLPRGTVS